MASGLHVEALEELTLSSDEEASESDEESVFPDKFEPEDLLLLDRNLSEDAFRALKERNSRLRPLARIQHCAGHGRTKRDEGSFKEHIKKECSKCIIDILPVSTWFPAITVASFRSDVIAGLTVSVMAVPESMSYASIAGLPYVFGLYSACVPALVYCLFGQSRQLAVGPVAMLSLLVSSGLEGVLTQQQCPAWYAQAVPKYTQQHLCPDEYANLAILTAAVVGALQIIAMMSGLGFLVSFLGHPVTSGFVSGAAITISLTQLKHILGIEVARSEFLSVMLTSYYNNIGRTNPITLILGLTCIVFLVTCKILSRRHKYLRMLGPVAPLVSCIAGSLLLYFCASLRTEYEVKFIGSIPGGFFPVTIGKWNLSCIGQILPTALSVCLIGYMEAIAMSKTLATKHSYSVDASHELLALGLSNLVGAMFSSYPVTGSFSRSAVNDGTGAVSQLAGLVASAAVLATLLFLTRLFYFLPDFSLAAIVISNVLRLIAYKEVQTLWKVKKFDFLLWMVSFLGTLFLGPLPGIAIAVGLSLSIVIFESVRPQIMILWRIPGTSTYRNIKQETGGVFVPNILITRIGSSIYFANASFIKDMLLSYVSDLEGINDVKYVIMDMSPVISLDSSAVHALVDIVTDFKKRRVEVAFSMVGNRAMKTLKKAHFQLVVKDQWFFPTIHDAVIGCLRHQHAKRLKCGSLMSPTTSTTAVSPSSAAKYDVQSVHAGNEIGLSNNQHHRDTVVFINLVKGVPNMMLEVLSIFQRRSFTVCRAYVDSVADALGRGQAHGCTQHIYHVQSTKSGGKLVDAELHALRVDLEILLSSHHRTVRPTRKYSEPESSDSDSDVSSVSSQGTNRWAV